MKVKIKKLSKDAIVPFKTYDKDFCYDVVAISEEEIAPNVWKYGLGLAFQIERGWETIIKGDELQSFGRIWACDTKIDLHNVLCNISIDFRPRSSIYKTGMVLSNSIGTVDELYTGEVSAIFYHVMQNMPRYHKGDKIGQIKLGITLPMDFIEVDKLDETERGNGGFGSTGTNNYNYETQSRR